MDTGDRPEATPDRTDIMAKTATMPEERMARGAETKAEDTWEKDFRTVAETKARTAVEDTSFKATKAVKEDTEIALVKDLERALPSES